MPRLCLLHRLYHNSHSPWSLFVTPPDRLSAHLNNGHYIKRLQYLVTLFPSIPPFFPDNMASWNSLPENIVCTTDPTQFHSLVVHHVLCANFVQILVHILPLCEHTMIHKILHSTKPRDQFSSSALQQALELDDLSWKYANYTSQKLWKQLTKNYTEIIRLHGTLLITWLGPPQVYLTTRVSCCSLEKKTKLNFLAWCQFWWKFLNIFLTFPDLLNSPTIPIFLISRVGSHPANFGRNGGIHFNKTWL